MIDSASPLWTPDPPALIRRADSSVAGELSLAMLGVTQLAGFGVGQQSDAPPAAASFTANASNSSAATTFNFASQSFGAEAADRSIIVGTTSQSATASVSSLSVGGVSAAPLLSINITNNSLEFWIAAVPTGSSGTVSVTWSTTRSRCAVILWRVTGLLSATAADSAQETGFGSTPGNGTINVPAGGVAVGMSSDAGTSSRTWTWAGITESVDTTYGSGRSYSGAVGNFASAQSGMAVSATPSGNTTAGIFAAVALR